MKRRPGPGPLFLITLLATLQPAMPVFAAPATTASSNVARAHQLANDVHEFATAPGLSRAKREKRIATAVRASVVAATAYRQDPAAVLGSATELAAAATRAAPEYAEVIIKAASMAPGVTRIDGASSSIRAAALNSGKGGKGGKGTRVAASSSPSASPTKSRAKAPKTTPPPVEEAEAYAAADRAQIMAETSATGGADSEAESVMAEELSSKTHHGRHPVEDPGVKFSLTLDASARRDDNIYQTPQNEIADTIISVRPGAGLRWGDKSQTHGNLSYVESFEHYVDGTSDNVALGNGSFEFAFQGAASSGGATARYQQLYQPSTDLQAQGFTRLIRSDVSSAGVHMEANPWAKIGGSLGLTYGNTDYKEGGLIGNSQYGIPFNILFNVTPKTDLSLGYTFSTQRPDAVETITPDPTRDTQGDSSKDHYLNVGARGQFTPKLSGTFNIGYQKRQVGDNPDEDMLAFNGSFDYELTPRTAMTLGMNRNFNASSLGATTKNTSVRLGLTTDFSPQFQMQAAATYFDNEYGEGVFRPDQIKPIQRTDHIWEASLSASYLFTEWFTGSAGYYFRSNNSTLPDVEYQSNVFSLTFGLKY